MPKAFIVQVPKHFYVRIILGLFDLSKGPNLPNLWWNQEEPNFQVIRAKLGQFSFSIMKGGSKEEPAPTHQMAECLE